MRLSAKKSVFSESCFFVSTGGSNENSFIVRRLHQSAKFSSETQDLLCFLEKRISWITVSGLLTDILHWLQWCTYICTYYFFRGTRNFHCIAFNTKVNFFIVLNNTFLSNVSDF